MSTGLAKAEHPEIPALAYLEILHANDEAIDDVIEFATKLLYREESHWGVMDVGELQGHEGARGEGADKGKADEGAAAHSAYTQ